MTPRLTHSKEHQTLVEVAVAPIVSAEVTDKSLVSINAFHDLTGLVHTFVSLLLREKGNAFIFLLFQNDAASVK